MQNLGGQVDIKSMLRFRTEYWSVCKKFIFGVKTQKWNFLYFLHLGSPPNGISISGRTQNISNLFAPSSVHTRDRMLKTVPFDLSTPLKVWTPRYFQKIFDALGAVGQKLSKSAIFRKIFLKNFSSSLLFRAWKRVEAIKKWTPSRFRCNFDILSKF